MTTAFANPVSIETTIRQFFAAYETRINRALSENQKLDTETATQAFIVSFVEAQPGGLVAFECDDLFRDAIFENYTFLHAIGTQSLHIRDLVMTPTDDHHTMAKICWIIDYRKKDGSLTTIEWNETFVMRTVDKIPEILAHVADDRQILLQERRNARR